MRTYKIIFGLLIFAWLFSALPLGYRYARLLVENPLHRQIYCSSFELLDKHPATAPVLSDWDVYLKKCLVKDEAHEKKVKEYLEQKREELAKKRKVIEIQLERKAEPEPEPNVEAKP